MEKCTLIWIFFLLTGVPCYTLNIDLIFMIYMTLTSRTQNLAVGPTHLVEKLSQKLNPPCWVKVCWTYTCLKLVGLKCRWKDKILPVDAHSASFTINSSMIVPWGDNKLVWNITSAPLLVRRYLTDLTVDVSSVVW